MKNVCQRHCGHLHLVKKAPGVSAKTSSERARSTAGRFVQLTRCLKVEKQLQTNEMAPPFPTLLRFPCKKPKAAATPARPASLRLCSPRPCRAAPTRAPPSLCSRRTQCTTSALPSAPSGPLDGRTDGKEGRRRRCAAVARGPGWHCIDGKIGGGESCYRRARKKGRRIASEEGWRSRHKGRVSLPAAGGGGGVEEILCAAEYVRAPVT